MEKVRPTVPDERKFMLAPAEAKVRPEAPNERIVLMLPVVERNGWLAMVCDLKSPTRPGPEAWIRPSKRREWSKRLNRSKWSKRLNRSKWLKRPNRSKWWNRSKQPKPKKGSNPQKGE